MSAVFRREPTLWLQALSAVLAIFVATGMPGLTAEQAALIIAVVSAVIGAVNAILVRPVAPAAFTGLIAAGAALLAGYGLDVAQPVVGSLQAATVAVLALLTRAQVTPAVAGPGGAYNVSDLDAAL